MSSLAREGGLKSTFWAGPEKIKAGEQDVLDPFARGAVGKVVQRGTHP